MKKERRKKFYFLQLFHFPGHIIVHQIRPHFMFIICISLSSIVVLVVVVAAPSCCCCGWSEAKQSKLLYVTNCLSACYDNNNNNKLNYCPKRWLHTDHPSFPTSSYPPLLHSPSSGRPQFVTKSFAVVSNCDEVWDLNACGQLTAVCTPHTHTHTTSKGVCVCGVCGVWGV